MNLVQFVEDYFALLDAGKADEAVAMFESDGRVNAPWETAMSPQRFVEHHLASASERRHRVTDILVSGSGRSAAAHFEYASMSPEGQENPFYVGCDHFTFGPSGRIEVLSIYCHPKHKVG